MINGRLEISHVQNVHYIFKLKCKFISFDVLAKKSSLFFENHKKLSVRNRNENFVLQTKKKTNYPMILKYQQSVCSFNFTQIKPIDQHSKPMKTRNKNIDKSITIFDQPVKMMDDSMKKKM